MRIVAARRKAGPRILVRGDSSSIRAGEIVIDKPGKGAFYATEAGDFRWRRAEFEPITGGQQ